MRFDDGSHEPPTSFGDRRCVTTSELAFLYPAFGAGPRKTQMYHGKFEILPLVPRWNPAFGAARGDRDAPSLSQSHV